MVFLIILGIVICLLIFLFVLFRPVTIVGDSMYPTLKEGEVYFTTRVTKHTKFTVGNVYIYLAPYQRRHCVIKRLKEISPTGELFFEGDNKEVSYDSRDYGYISKEKVKFRVVLRKEQK